MTEDEKRLKKNEYMRTYTAKHREKIREAARERAARIKANPEEYERALAKHRIASKKYSEANRDKINTAAKAKNWNFNKNNAKVNRKKYYNNHTVKSILASIKHRAKNKKLPYDLTEEWYNTELEKGCAVTGLEIKADGSNGPFTAHVDRKVPELGYTIDNCCLVCACYNLAKKNWTDEDVLKMAKALIENME